MNTKAIVFIVVVIAIGLAIYFMPNFGNEKGTSPVQNSPMSQMEGEQAHTHAPLPEIDSLSVAVQDSAGTDMGTVTLIPHQSVPLPGTDYLLHLSSFYTHLMMEDSGPVNVSPHPENQAARIEIFRGNEAVDYSWTFEKIPFFRMNGMGGPHDRESTGLSFAIVNVYGLEVPGDSPNP